MKNFDLKLEDLILKKYNIQLDRSQKNVVLSLKEMLEESFFINKFKKALFKKKNGIYFYGKVGRGKSLICSAINNLLLKKSEAEIFNNLIFKLQKNQISGGKEMEETENFNELLPQTQMLIIDELQLDNIADIHLIFKFVKLAKKKKIFLVFISNRSPENLYENIQEDKFIDEFKDFFRNNYYLLKNESSKDYRMSNKIGNHFFFFGKNKNNKRQDFLVKRIIKNADTKYLFISDQINIKFKLNRKFKLIDCDFDEICSSVLGNKEYKIISESFNYIIIRNIPILDEEKKDSIARFILLIDNIYKRKIFLSVSSKFGLDKIFDARTRKFEFKRTYSRLVEMGSQKYISSFL